MPPAEMSSLFPSTGCGYEAIPRGTSVSQRQAERDRALQLNLESQPLLSLHGQVLKFVTLMSHGRVVPQISSALDSEGRVKDPRLDPYVRKLRSVLAKTLTAVESSGLRHNELWSYRIVDDDLAPIRFPTSSDIQLWNLTDLAVRYALARIPNL